jgi:putative transposase
MCASDVTATLDQALAASGLGRVTVVHRRRDLLIAGSAITMGAMLPSEASAASHSINSRSQGRDNMTTVTAKRWHEDIL